jgi:triosephosphate isomerase (TIM)
MAKKLLAGNWKMNGTRAALDQVRALMAAHPRPRPGVALLLCPPATLIAGMADLAKGHALHIGGQDCHAAEKGAHTGDISAPMLADAGASHVILGHSERRADHGETDADVAAKLTAAQAAGLTPILCLGETLGDRDAGQALQVVTGQLSGSIPDGADLGNLIVAYEPVWAIGTGRVAEPGQIAEVHATLRQALRDRFGEIAAAIPLLYGGSVNPGNAAVIFGIANVEGALVGGASLKAADFGAILEALEAA